MNCHVLAKVSDKEGRRAEEGKGSRRYLGSRNVLCRHSSVSTRPQNHTPPWHRPPAQQAVPPSRRAARCGPCPSAADPAVTLVGAAQSADGTGAETHPGGRGTWTYADPSGLQVADAASWGEGLPTKEDPEKENSMRTWVRAGGTSSERAELRWFLKTFTQGKYQQHTVWLSDMLMRERGWAPTSQF